MNSFMQLNTLPHACFLLISYLSPQYLKSFIILHLRRGGEGRGGEGGAGGGGNEGSEFNKEDKEEKGVGVLYFMKGSVSFPLKLLDHGRYSTTTSIATYNCNYANNLIQMQLQQEPA